MIELDEYLTPFGMDSLNYLFPPLHLLLVIETRSTERPSTFDSPWSALGDHQSTSNSLGVVLYKHISRNTEFRITSLSGKGRHDDSVIEDKIGS